MTAMSAALPAPDAPDVPVTSVPEAIARMEAIGAALPAADGFACFNRMYLEVTRQVYNELGQGFYAEPAFMTELDVKFANLYFDAIDVAGNPADVPLAWRPLAERREMTGIEEIQFALAGMNAHINHDLPIAVVETCKALTTSPEDSEHFADYQKVDRLLDAAEQSIRQSFETRVELGLDHHLSAVATLTCNWARPGPGVGQLPAAVGAPRYPGRARPLPAQPGRRDRPGQPAAAGGSLRVPIWGPGAESGDLSPISAIAVRMGRWRRFCARS